MISGFYPVPGDKILVDDNFKVALGLFIHRTNVILFYIFDNLFPSILCFLGLFFFFSSVPYPLQSWGQNWPCPGGHKFKT